MSTMRAIAIDRFGGADLLSIHILPVPTINSQEVLIAVDVAGVGAWDARARSGAWAERDDDFPLVLGVDGAGTVVATGSRVRRLRAGDRVYAYSYDNPKGGFYAEYVAVAASKAAPVPEGLDPLEGADAAVNGKRGDIVAARCLDALRKGGRAAYPNGVEPVPKKRKGIRIKAYDAVPGVREFERLRRAIKESDLRIPIAAVFDLQEARFAHERVEKGQLLGKVALKVGAT